MCVFRGHEEQRSWPHLSLQTSYHCPNSKWSQKREYTVKNTSPKNTEQGGERWRMAQKSKKNTLLSNHSVKLSRKVQCLNVLNSLCPNLPILFPFPVASPPPFSCSHSNSDLSILSSLFPTCPIICQLYFHNFPQIPFHFYFQHNLCSCSHFLVLLSVVLATFQLKHHSNVIYFTECSWIDLITVSLPLLLLKTFSDFHCLPDKVQTPECTTQWPHSVGSFNLSQFISYNSPLSLVQINHLYFKANKS